MHVGSSFHMSSESLSHNLLYGQVYVAAKAYLSVGYLTTVFKISPTGSRISNFMSRYLTDRTIQVTLSLFPGPVSLVNSEKLRFHNLQIAYFYSRQ